MRRVAHLAGGLLLAVALGGCRLAAEPGTDDPAASSPAASSPAAHGASQPAATPGDSASASADPTMASPGLPYQAAEILAAMVDSRRPGGVPDQLETSAVAAAIAARAWTWTGAAWEVMAVGGACGPTACSLDLAGTPLGSAGTDLYSFTVDPTSGEVSLVSHDLHGHPAGLEAELDAAARAALGDERLDGLALAGARWLPPPEADRYWLAYRSGGEEGAPRLDVLLDLASGEVLQVVETGDD